MPWYFNPFTGTFGYYRTSAAAPDISGGLDNLLLYSTDNFLLYGSSEDVLLFV